MSSVRVANELGAGSGKGARFAIVVSITTSVLIGLVFWCLILYFNDHFALLFTSSEVVLAAVHKLSVLLALTILLNSVQPVLSGKLTADEPGLHIPTSKQDELTFSVLLPLQGSPLVQDGKLWSPT
jgi:Na+-driven multidrug efflux pump